MCFKLDNGSELFSIQDMHRLRKSSSGVMGSVSWVAERSHEDASPACKGDGTCSCKVKCARCRCQELDRHEHDS